LLGGKIFAKRLLIAALVAVATLATSALAQKNELTGITGRTFISDQGVPNTGLANSNIHFGKGTTFEVNYGRHFIGNGFTQLTFEVPAVFNLDEDIQFKENVIPESFRSYFVTPGLRANVFANTAVSPWFSLGGGFGHFSPSSNLEFGGRQSCQIKYDRRNAIWLRPRRSRVEELLHTRWSPRLLVGHTNLNVDTGKSRQHNYLVGGGVVWHFGKI
jgi:hypothetical protein